MNKAVILNTIDEAGQFINSKYDYGIKIITTSYSVSIYLVYFMIFHSYWINRRILAVTMVA